MLQFASVVDHADWLAVWVEKEMAAHSSTLAWRIPGTGEPGGCHLWAHRVGHD